MDLLDFDQYLESDPLNLVSPSPQTSPATMTATPTSSKSKAALNIPEMPTRPSNVAHPQQPDPSSMLFAGPSHQYDLHKQQTSLPVGGLANSFALAGRPLPTSTMGYGHDWSLDWAMAAGGPSLGSNSGLFDMGSAQTVNSVPVTRHLSTSTSRSRTSSAASFQNAPDAFNLGNTPSLLNDANLDAMGMDGLLTSDLAQNEVDSDQASDVSEVTIRGGGGMSRVNSVSAPSQQNDASSASRVGKVWPGMHRQAALAAARQQQSAQASSSGMTSAMPALATQNPVVERNINRILDSMRTGGTTPTSASMSHDGLPHMPRVKKAEEDMDEDERLLASEQGKKLSSKERRQLRNKVSARAFRSRRKEYIGQLEGELAAKGQELDDVRAENEALRAENGRLSDLTRMLLSSSAFASFLEEFQSGARSLPGGAMNGGMNAGPSAPTQTAAPSTSSARIPKDVNPQHAMTKNQMAMSTSEPSMDFATGPTTNGAQNSLPGWGAGLDFNMDNVQVFAATEFPAGPIVEQMDSGVLSGKLSDLAASVPLRTEPGKIQASELTLPEAPIASSDSVQETHQEDIDVEVDETEPAFALFADQPKSSPSKDEAAVASAGDVSMSAVPATEADLKRFQGVCSVLDVLGERILNVVPE